MPEEVEDAFLSDALGMSYRDLQDAPQEYINAALAYKEGKAKAENKKAELARRKSTGKRR